MSDDQFNARLARIAQSRAPQPNPTQSAPGRSNQPKPGSHRARLQRALAVAATAGIREADCFPPFMRGLSAVGLPVRPLHFKSAGSLFVNGVLLGLFVFGGALWAASTPVFEGLARGPVAGLVSLGWPGVFAVSGMIGVAFALIIKAKARQAGLPRWGEL